MLKQTATCLDAMGGLRDSAAEGPRPFNGGGGYSEVSPLLLMAGTDLQCENKDTCSLPAPGARAVGRGSFPSLLTSPTCRSLSI